VRGEKEIGGKLGDLKAKETHKETKETYEET
jgi:hypothetical protein